MAIIAILSILSASAFINARNQAVVSDATEQLLSALREAQNRSMSVTKGESTQDGYQTKAWGVEIYENNFNLRYFDAKNGDIAGLTMVDPPQGSQDIYPGISFNTSLNGGANAFPRYIMYSSPFAKTYTTTGISCETGDPCSWSQSTSQALDWAPSRNDFTGMTDVITIRITYRGAEQTIKVNAKGDAYIE